MATHEHTLAAARSQRQMILATQHDDTLSQVVEPLLAHTRRTVLQGKATDAWLWAMPSHYHGTVLSSQEFRDALHLRYGREPADLPASCDGCVQRFSIEHALTCQKGGLPILRHNEVRDELMDLARRAFGNSAVRTEPLIFPGRAAPSSTGPAASRPSVPSDERGDVLIRGLWERGTDCILDIHVTNTDALRTMRKLHPRSLPPRRLTKSTTISSHAWISASTSHPLSCLLMACLARRPTRFSNNWPLRSPARLIVPTLWSAHSCVPV